MRFSLTDLFIGVVCVLTGTFTGVLGAIVLKRPDLDLLFALPCGLLGYLLISPLIYRRFKLRPLLYPQCPSCQDKNRAYRFTRPKPPWPRDEITCVNCQTRIELWYESPPAAASSRSKPAFKLLWPQSWGRWRSLSKTT